MNNTQYTIYWMENNSPQVKETSILTEALSFMEVLRANINNRAITMAAETINQVGKMGVTSVENKTLPDGQEYVYKTGRDRGR